MKPAVIADNTLFSTLKRTNWDADNTKGHAVSDSDLVHLSPALYAHINRYGKYHFETMPLLDQQPRRPLRQPSILKA